MRNLFLLIISLLCWNVRSQYIVNWVNPYTDGTGLNGICFTDASHGWAVGDNGKILFFDEQRWQHIPAITNANLNGVTFTDEDHGWAVGDGGGILKYDAGTWSLENSGTTNDLRAVKMLSPEKGWAVGQGILQYNGVSWTLTNSSLDLYTLFFLDDAHGWAGGFDTLLKYDGVSWTAESLPYKLGDYFCINSIWMNDTAFGWASGWCGADEDAMTLNYNGTSWENSVWPHYSFAIHSLYFNEIYHGWDCGHGGSFGYGPSIWEFDNDAWNLYKRTNDYPSSIYGLNSNDIYASATLGNIYHYDGDQWGLSNSILDGTAVVSFPDTLHGWAVGLTDAIFSFSDGLWHRDTLFPGLEFENIHFADSTYGWAEAVEDVTPYSYFLFEYKDGLWHRYPTTYGWIRDLWSISNGYAWILSQPDYDTGIILKINQDTTIQYIMPGLGLASVCFPDASHGWVAAGVYNKRLPGVILKYSGGEWTTQQSFDKKMSTISLSDSTFGFAATSSSSNVIYFYNGTEWVEQLQFSSFMLDMACVDHNHAYGVLSNGVLLSFDGYDWRQDTITGPYRLSSLSFPCPELGWTGGEGGAILSVRPANNVGIGKYFNMGISHRMHLYPDPVAGHILNIDFTAATGNNITIEIYDLNGSRLSSQLYPAMEVGKNHLSIGIQNLSSGIYILQLSCGNEKYAGKFMVCD